MRLRAMGRYAAGLTVGLVTLAGCTTSTPDPGSVSTPASLPASTTSVATSTGASPTSTPSANTTSSSNDRTLVGAQEFVSLYVARLNESLKTANPDLIKDLAADTCKTCATWLARANTLKSEGRHLTGDLLSPTTLTTSKLSDTSAEVLLYGEQRGADVVNSAGAKVDAVPKIAKANFLFTLTYDQGWKVGLWQTEA